MLDTRIVLSGLWVATMLTFLWGDVLGSISGYTEPGKLGESVYAATHGIWVGIAALMMSPIVMIVLNLTLNHRAIRWANIIVAIAFIVIDGIGFIIPRPLYENIMGIGYVVFCALIVWYAWKWSEQEE